MTLIVRFETEAIATATQAAYRRDDFSLVYSHKRSETYVVQTFADVIDERLRMRRDRPFLAIADTLVLTFIGPARELAAFDAYINWNLWNRSDYLQLPNVSRIGRVCLADTFEDDRVSLGVVPQYTYSEERRLLQIELESPHQELSYCRVSDRLIVGVIANQLAVLFLEDLSIQ